MLFITHGLSPKYVIYATTYMSPTLKEPLSVSLKPFVRHTSLTPSQCICAHFLNDLFRM
jgi:hypothetical protein